MSVEVEDDFYLNLINVICMIGWLPYVSVLSLILIFVILDDFYGTSHVYIPCIWVVPLFA